MQQTCICPTTGQHRPESHRVPARLRRSWPPIIMLRQNRQAAIDRRPAKHDDQVNLKALLEVQPLHQKFAHLMDEWHRLPKIRALQLEMLEDLMSQRSRSQR